MKTIWNSKHFTELSNEELYSIIHLRLEVFAVEQNCAYQDADGKDQVSFHICGYTDAKELIAYARILPPGISYKEASIGRIVTAQKVRALGVGKELMQKSFEFISTKYGKVPIRISAQCYLTKFYSNLGFEVIGEEYEEDHIPHIEMLKPA